MRPRLVFVHGIGAPRDPAPAVAAWTEALARGARAAGHDSFAQSLLAGTAADVVFADYRDLYFAAAAQGGDAAELAWDEAEAELLALLVGELIDMRLESDADVEVVRVLERARAQLGPGGQAQGFGNILGNAINAATTLLSIRPLRRSGQWIGGRFMLGHLAQVSRYLARGEPADDGRPLDERIRERLLTAIGAEGAVVVAHSLGTVVAFEALHKSAATVPLLVTMGSPLGLRTVVLPRLRPSPPSTPERVHRWLNFWDRDDFIAARPHIERVILPNSRGVAPNSDGRVDSDGLWVHSAEKYLSEAKVAGPVAEALNAMAALSAER